MGKDRKTELRLIIQALGAAQNSINLAREMLSDLDGSVVPDSKASKSEKEKLSLVSDAATQPELPGIIGTFDGQFMVSGDGQKYPVPENYASKSMIVFGDKLKMVDVNGQTRFKQVERVKRQVVLGILLTKEGKSHVVTSDGSYKVLSAAISHFGGKEGDEVQILLPFGAKHSPFATVEKIIGKKEEKVLDIASLPDAPATKGGTVLKKPREPKKATSKKDDKVVGDSGVDGDLR